MGGGGVALYVRDHWQFKSLAASSTTEDDTFENRPEFLISELQYSKHKVLVAMVYRRPQAALFHELFDTLSTFLPHYKYLVITGDFNANLLSPRSRETMNLRRQLRSNALHIVSTQPTHHLIDRSIPVHNSLDLFIVNDLSLVHSFSQSQSPFIAGHDFITIRLFLTHPKLPLLTIMTHQLSKLDNKTSHNDLHYKLFRLFLDNNTALRPLSDNFSQNETLGYP